MPAGICDDFVGGIVVDGAGDVAVRIGLFDGAALGIDDEGGDEILAAAGRRGPVESIEQTQIAGRNVGGVRQLTSWICSTTAPVFWSYSV